MALIPIQDIAAPAHVPIGQVIAKQQAADRAKIMEQQQIEQSKQTLAMNAQKLKDQQEADRDQAGLDQIMASGADRATMQAAADKLGVKAASTLVKHFSDMDAASLKQTQDRLLNVKEHGNVAKTFMSTEAVMKNDPNIPLIYKHWRDGLIASGDELAKQMPDTWNPQYMEQYASAMDRVKYVSDLAEEARKAKDQAMQESKAIQDAQAAQDAHQAALDKRAELDSTPDIKNFNNRYEKEYLPTKGVTSMAQLTPAQDAQYRTEFRKVLENEKNNAASQQSETVIPTKGGKPTLANYNPKTGTYTDTKGNLLPDAEPYIKPSADGGISPNQEALITERLTKQWTVASKTAGELDRQVQIMDKGLEASRNGDKNAGAQAVLVTFQKILDPNSVVRESEYARSGSGLALMTRIEGAVEKLQKGGAGVPQDELENFAKLAHQMATAASSHMNAVKDRIGRNADKYKIARDLIFEDYDLSNPGAGAPSPAPVTKPTTGTDKTKRPPLSSFEH